MRAQRSGPGRAAARRRRGEAVAAAVALAVILAALAGAWYLHREASVRAEERNQERVAQAEESLRDIVGDVGVLLRVSEAFLTEQEFATEGEFRRFVMRVAQRDTPAAGVAWVPFVPAERRARFDAARAGADPPMPVAGRPIAGDAAPILYFATRTGGRVDALGIDLRADPVRRRLLDDAVATGAPVLSSVTAVLPAGARGIVLAQTGTGPFPGGGRITGALLAPIPLASLSRALRMRAPGVEVRLDEGGTRLLGPASAPADAGVRTVRLAGRTFTLTAWGPAGEQPIAALAVALLGTAAAALLGLLLAQGARRERRIAAEVAARTRELAAERDRSGAVVARAQDAIAIVGADGAILRANDRYADLAGRPAADLEGARPPFPWWSPRGRTMAALRLEAALGGTASEPVEIEGADRGAGARTVMIAHAPLVPGRPEEGAVEVATDITAVRRAERTEAALARIAVEAVDALGGDGPVRAVADEARRLLNAETCRVVERTPEPGWRVLASARAGAGAAGADREVGSAPIAAEVAVLDELVVAEGPQRVTDGEGRTRLAVPIPDGPALWGALVVTGRPGAAPAPDDEARLVRVAQLAALTLSRARSLDQLALGARTDALTGLGNDRSLRAALGEVLTAAGPTDATALALIRADGIAGSGDLLAGGRGAALVVRVADALRSAAAAEDHVARVGGDTFAWVMPGADDARALDAMERLRGMLATGHEAPVTVCAGVADADPGRRDARTLVAAAERALQHAVDTGPDRVVAHHPALDGRDGPGASARRVERALSAAALRALARAVDAKDPDTREHSERVAAVAAAVATTLRWPASRVERLRDAALVHDIGKIGVPDAVLFKPGPLTGAEWQQVQAHAALGADIAMGVLDEEQAGWVRHHHERWDGAGYPATLAGEAIPDGARVLAVADAYDVMTSVRTYKAPRSVEDALDEVGRCSGAQFDPAVAGALRRLAALDLLPGGRAG